MSMNVKINEYRRRLCEGVGWRGYCERTPNVRSLATCSVEKVTEVLKDMRKDILAVTNFNLLSCYYVVNALQLAVILFFVCHYDNKAAILSMRFRPLPIPVYADVLTDNITEVLVEKYHTGCKLPRGGYKAWKQGVLTTMKPEIKRNCSLLFKGDEREVQRIRKENEDWNSMKFNMSFYSKVLYGSCSLIRSEFMDNLYVTKEELDFPLAFSLNIHENPQQIFRFLKVIYRPHNLYCLHYDEKSSQPMKIAINNVAKCLGNVLVPRTPVNVVWGCYTIMEAQMNCITELYRARSPSYPWRYLTTLCGKELPLRTNREIVNILKKKNGSPMLKVYPLNDVERSNRFTYRFVIGSDNGCHQTNLELGPPPNGVEIRKNMAYFSLTPDFVHFLLHNQTALELYEFMKGASNAEEHFFSTAYSLTGAHVDITEPKNEEEKNSDQVVLTSDVSDCIWNFHGAKCDSWIIHFMCVISSSDLYQLKYKVDLDDIQGPLFHNKYFMERDHTVMDCLEEQLVIRNKQEYIRDCGGMSQRHRTKTPP